MVVLDFDGIFFCSWSLFFYFMLVVFEVGGVVWVFVFFLCFLLCWFLYYCVLEFIGICFLIFVIFVGLKIGGIEVIVCGMLLKFYVEDVYLDIWWIFFLFGEWYIFMVMLWIMVEIFVKMYLGVDGVLGMELYFIFGGIVIGLLMNLGVLIGRNKEIVLR